MKRTLDPGFDPRIADWLEDDPDRAPSLVLETVVGALPSIPQRHSWRAAWRIPRMPRFAAAGVAVLVLAAVALVGLLWRPAGGPGAPTPSPSATPAPTASPRTLTDIDQGLDLPSGTYRAGDGFTTPLTLSLPEGWTLVTLQSNALFLERREPPETRLPILLRLLRPESVYGDPCHREGGAGVVGPTTADLVSALSSVDGFESSAVSDVTLDDRSGKMLTLTHSTDRAAAGCTDNTLELMTYERFGTAQDVDVFPTAEEQIWVLEVSGARLLIWATVFDYSSQEERAEVENIISSINFD